MVVIGRRSLIEIAEIALEQINHIPYELFRDAFIQAIALLEIVACFYGGSFT